MEVVLIVQGEGGGDLAALAVGLAAAAGRVMYAPGLQAHVDRLHIQHVIMGLQHAVLFHGSRLGLPGLGQHFLLVAQDGSFNGVEPFQGLVQVVGQVAVFGLVHKIAVAVAHLHQVIIHHLRGVK